MVPLACTVEPQDGRAFLRVSGEIDLTTTEMFWCQLQDVLRLSDKVIIDLRHVSYMDSTGIKALESAAKRGGNIVLILPAMVRRLIEITGLDQMIPIHEDSSRL